MARKRKKRVVLPSDRVNSQPAAPQPQGGQRPPLLREAHIEEHRYSGPIPNPALLKEFDNVLPGCAERIIRMAEEQATHRQLLERTVIIGDSRRANQGLWVGGAVAVLFLAGAVFLIYNGHDAAGATLGTMDLASVVGIFIYGTVSRRAERLKKAKVMSTSAQNENGD